MYNHEALEYCCQRCEHDDCENTYSKIHLKENHYSLGVINVKSSHFEIVHRETEYSNTDTEKTESDASNVKKDVRKFPMHRL